MRDLCGDQDPPSLRYVEASWSPSRVAMNGRAVISPVAALWGTSLIAVLRAAKVNRDARPTNQTEIKTTYYI